MAFIERVSSVCSSIHLASLKLCSRGLSSCGSTAIMDDIASTAKLSPPRAEVACSGSGAPTRRLTRLGRARALATAVVGGIGLSHAPGRVALALQDQKESDGSEE